MMSGCQTTFENMDDEELDWLAEQRSPQFVYNPALEHNRRAAEAEILRRQSVDMAYAKSAYRKDAE